MKGLVRGAAISGAVALLLSACWSGGDFPNRVAFVGYDADLYRGSGHCDWDGTWFIQVTDRSFGVETDGVFPVYVRDPSEIDFFTYASQSDLDARLPSGASMLAGSADGYELWFDPSDETLMYLVTDDRVEAWALATNFSGCD